MKAYLSNAVYFETQAEAKAEAKVSGEGFEVVDFPFGATPKADFIGWLNNGSWPRAKVEVEARERSEPEVYDSALPAFQPRKPMVVRAGPPTPEVIAADKAATAVRLRQVDIEEAIQSSELPALATYAANVAWRFEELARGPKGFPLKTPQCPHGAPLVMRCEDCEREHREATA